MDLGAHCSVPACHQQDFLPFTCDCCSNVFCLKHRSYGAHQCPKAGSHDRRVVQCPVCKQMIRWTAEQDVNAVWEQHVRSGQCTPEKLKQQQLKQSKKPKKKRCAAEGCREVLLPSNQFHCRKCSQDVCLKHRFEADHTCEKKRQAQRQQWLGELKPWSSNKAKPKQTSQLPRAAGSATITTNTERCPMCQQKFNYVSQLIAHVNRAHPDISDSDGASASGITSQVAVRAAASAGNPPASEVCPQCHAVFSTLSGLIQHAETAHTGAVADSGRRTGDQEKCNVM
ncbi:unnamed protein product [Peronospora destructor]|uniref:Zinc finger AN1 and C2H2 domain-containing stress-associated protein 16 n=1 Tax=Peronospora destructor TaxID=86335 RepID=A0AAV0V0P5_9STRA|nr:unnamed protein product [Peronospora destructor]